MSQHHAGNRVSIQLIVLEDGDGTSLFPVELRYIRPPGLDLRPRSLASGCANVGADGTVNPSAQRMVHIGVRTGGHMSRAFEEPELMTRRRAFAPTGTSSDGCLRKTVDSRTLAR
jgi:hypothetical protein